MALLFGQPKLGPLDADWLRLLHLHSSYGTSREYFRKDISNWTHRRSPRAGILRRVQSLWFLWRHTTPSLHDSVHFRVCINARSALASHAAARHQKRASKQKGISLCAPLRLLLVEHIHSFPARLATTCICHSNCCARCSHLLVSLAAVYLFTALTLFRPTHGTKRISFVCCNATTSTSLTHAPPNSAFIRPRPRRMSFNGPSAPPFPPSPLWQHHTANYHGTTLKRC
jgi:hypothetical protein